MTEACPMCGQPVAESGGAVQLTPAQLDALSAWWHTGSVKGAADLLSRSERTVINQLHSARIRNAVHTTPQLVHLYIGQLRSVRELVTRHNLARGKAA